MNIEGFLSYFEEIEDPRIDRTKKHLLSDIIVIAVISFICGAETWEDIEDFGNANKDWLSKHLKLPHGIPSHDTFARIFMRVNPKVFQECFVSLMHHWADKSNGDFIALDGKCLRRSHNRKHNQHPLHLVSAWSTKNNLTLGQIKTDKKSNEITAIKELLKLIDIKNCTITIDAIGCQREVATQIIEAAGDYILAVKANQGYLYNGLISLFQKAKEQNYNAMVFSKDETIDGDHGRIETRCYTVLPLMYAFSFKEKWRGLQSFIKVESKREINNRISVENRYYISSLKPDAKKIGDGIRGHWSIENSLHWCLDVIFNEDECRIRTGHAPENIALIRRFVLSLLKKETTFKGGLRRKQRNALMDNEYLTRILAGI